MSLASLPTELYSVIMDQLPPESLHHSLLQLTRALPSAPISLHPLFQCITLRRPEQATSLIRRLIKPDGAEVSLYVQELSLHDVWTVDADVMVNVLRKLRKLSSLSLCVGTNFAPEHLKAILEIPRPDLRYLSLRFRP
ncbi:hypothetical protein B0H15DRAFT_811102 [Mycena belliarum]|uniref:F-box domain-containing protein n=1 Tax=Mycena belliarum TaxID=1033014 RepID=A0AAD6ULF3_9AGAR|nr:hypothetical protein B0H15DRAFT_811102 [Mycena belliae]